MIVQGSTRAWKLGVLQDQIADVYRMALYTDKAMLNKLTEAYITEGEVPVLDVQGSPTGYEAGGQVLTGGVVGLDGDVVFMDWADPLWPRSTITARGALIYNFSKQNRAVAVLDLGKNFSSTNGNFLVTLPEPTAKTALIRIGG